MTDIPASRLPVARKAVIPAAGMGTRFLPATKAVPKELLPVVDTPALEYIVAEAAGAALSDVLVITSQGKDAIADHFDQAPAIEAALERKGDTARLGAVRRSNDLARMTFVRQQNPQGLGHAVSYAETFTAGEPFAVLLGDDMIDQSETLLTDMLELQAREGGVVLALIEVPREDVSRYGVVDAGGNTSDVVPVLDMVEKPPTDEAPSNLAVIGRYVLPPEIFGAIRATGAGAGGEIQLTDAIRRLGASGVPVHGIVYRGRRFDTGDRLEYLKASVQLGTEHADIGPAFTAWLQEYVAGLR